LEYALVDVPLTGPPGRLESEPTPVTMRSAAPTSVQPVAAVRFLSVGLGAPSFGEVNSLLDLRALLDRAALSSQYVVVDAPPLFDADTIELTRHVDALLFVVGLQNVDRRALQEAGRLLDSANAAVLGCVVTGSDLDPEAHIPSYQPDGRVRG
jgi:Mrp family chromosome partitioning ATPase